MLNKINVLSETSRKLGDGINKQDERIKNLMDEKLKMEKEKQDEIDKLKTNIDEMSQNFAAMLKDTLENMKKRIEWANSDWEKENDSKLLKNFENEIG